MIYLQLFCEFFKTGLFSVGGGMATIPFLTNMSDRLSWFTYGELADMIAVAESTPGPIGINAATYVGYRVCTPLYGIPGGILGGVVATIGLVTPSVIIITIIASFLEKFRRNRYVDSSFYGLRPASVGLILAAAVSVILIAFLNIGNIYAITSAGVPDYRYLILAALLVYLTSFAPKKIQKLHPLFFIIIAAAVGIVWKL